MIDGARIGRMIEHWLTTPANGYFGSSYGADLASLLLKPLSRPVGDQFIAKLKTDVPILASLSSDQLELYSRDEGFERKIIYLRIADVKINLNQVYDQMQAGGETVDANAG